MTYLNEGLAELFPSQMKDTEDFCLECVILILSLLVFYERIQRVSYAIIKYN